MATTDRLNGESIYPHETELDHELAQIVMRRLATQDEALAQLRVDFAALRDIVISFADKLEHTAGYMSREAGLLRDLLR